MSDGQVTLSMLHELALLYLGLAHGADGNLDPEECHEIEAKLRRWQPDKDPAMIHHVLREATLSYMDDLSDRRINQAVSTLRRTLPDWLRQEIVDDMADVAKADGAVVAGETDFISRLARDWNVAAQPA